MTSSKNSCWVCGEHVEPHTEAFCGQCGRAYHLNQRTDMPGKDCGQVWINEDHLALEFACDRCLHPEPEVVAADLAQILDIAEAALAAGLAEAVLAAAAEAGSLRHRRTAGGVYLFERRDVIVYARGGDA